MIKRIISIFLISIIVLSAFFSPCVAAFDNEGFSVYKAQNYYYTIINNEIAIGRYTGKASTVKVPSKIKGLPVTTFGVQLDEEGKWKCGFENNKYIKHIVFPKSVKAILGYSVRKCKNLKSVVIKGKVKEIEWSTFSECPKLKKIKLPNSVKVIYEEAFKNTGLSKFTIGKNVKSFFPDSIAGTKIKSIKVAKSNKSFISKYGVLYNNNKTILRCYPPNKRGKTFIIPKKTLIIDCYAFGTNNKYLKKIVISKNIKKIDENAFQGCSKLSEIKINTKKNLKIYDFAFFNCFSLKSVTIPKYVNKIGKYAFGFMWKSTSNNPMKVKGFTIKGYKGTAAEKYAKKNGFKFVALDK